jgi:transketolase
LEDTDQPDIILMASGSEVSLIVEAADQLQNEGIQVRIISMPSWELFELQDAEYQASILPSEIRVRLAVEAGVPQGWEKYVGNDGDILGINQFGASGHSTDVLQKFGFTPDNVVQHAKNLLAKHRRLP